MEIKETVSFLNELKTNYEEGSIDEDYYNWLSDPYKEKLLNQVDDYVAEGKGLDFITNNTEIEITRHEGDEKTNEKGYAAFSSDLEVKIFGVSVFSSKVQAYKTQDEHNGFTGYNLEEKKYTGTLVDSWGSYLNVIYIENSVAIHPNASTGDDPNAGEWGQTIGLGCPILRLPSFNTMVNKLKTIGFEYTDDIQKRDKIQINIRKD
jgi:hypothetical protein